MSEFAAKMLDAIENGRRRDAGTARARATLTALERRWGRFSYVGDPKNPEEVLISSMAAEPERWVKVAKDLYEKLED